MRDGIFVSVKNPTSNAKIIDLNFIIIAYLKWQKSKIIFSI
jgi:hypothetical protein